MVMIEERFSDHCDMCGASSDSGLFAVFNSDDKNSMIHICPDCIEGISKCLDEMIVNTAKFGKSIRDFLRAEKGGKRMKCNFCDIEASDAHKWIVVRVPGMGLTYYCPKCQKKYLSNCVKKKLGVKL